MIMMDGLLEVKDLYNLQEEVPTNMQILIQRKKMLIL